jgi:hypothetical protein
MKKLIIGLVAVVAAVLLAACVSLSDKAAKVQFHTHVSSTLDGCKRIGPVLVVVSAFSPNAKSSISVKLREAAADLGADSVVQLNTDETFTETRVQGIAFKCY